MSRSITAAVLSLAVSLTACSAKTSEISQPVSSDLPAPASTQAAAPTRANPPGHVGATLNLTTANQTPVQVTLTRVINSATGKLGPPTDGGGKPDGTYVAVMLTIKNADKSPLKGDVNNNTVLIGSNDQTYTPDFNDVTECTNFDDGIYDLDAGESASGCVVFVVPRSVAPARFKYTPSSGFASDFGEWLIP